MNILPFCSSKETYSSKVKETGQVILDIYYIEFIWNVEITIYLY